jgi:hypothetical protein
VVPIAKPSLFDQGMRQNNHFWVEMKAKPAYFVSNRQKQHIKKVKRPLGKPAHFGQWYLPQNSHFLIKAGGKTLIVGWK